MLHHSPLLRALAVGYAFVFVLSCASIGLAQSGRRARKPTPAPVATPEPTPESLQTSSSEKPKPRLTFLVGMDRPDAFAGIPVYAYEGILRSVTNRLGDDPTIDVVPTQRDMGRGEAVQKAKAEKEAFVVWLQVRRDTISGDSRNTGDLDDIIIEYSVFTPTTAKVATFGRTYPGSQRTRVIIPGPRTSGIYGDRYLNQAAEEAAEKILSHFRRNPAPGRRP